MCSNPNESTSLPIASLPACVSAYLNSIEQWTRIKAERLIHEQEVIKWMQTQNKTAIPLEDGSRLRLSQENIHNPINKNQLLTGLQSFLRVALPTLDLEKMNTSVEQLSCEMAQHVWKLRCEHHVVKIRRLSPSQHDNSS